MSGNENRTLWAVFSCWEGDIVSAVRTEWWRDDGPAGRITPGTAHSGRPSRFSSEFRMQTAYLFRSGVLAAFGAAVALGLSLPASLSAEDKKDDGWIPLFN